MSIAVQAKQVYEEIKAELEAKHRDQFIAIEPQSKTHYIAATFLDAAILAKRAYPTRKSFVIRIGHDAAFQARTCGHAGA